MNFVGLDKSLSDLSDLMPAGVPIHFIAARGVDGSWKFSGIVSHHGVQVSRCDKPTPAALVSSLQDGLRAERDRVANASIADLCE